MFGLTKREQRWAAEQKAAETIVPLLTAAIEARTAMDTNDRIAALERGLTQAVQMYTDAAGERDKALADLAAAQAERDALFRSKSTLNTRVLAAEAEVQALRVAHEAALKESVAKEREECAQTIGHCGGFDPHIRAQLVEAIRARSKP